MRRCRRCCSCHYLVVSLGFSFLPMQKVLILLFCFLCPFPYRTHWPNVKHVAQLLYFYYIFQGWTHVWYSFGLLDIDECFSFFHIFVCCCCCCCFNSNGLSLDLTRKKRELRPNAMKAILCWSQSKMCRERERGK